MDRLTCPRSLLTALAAAALIATGCARSGPESGLPGAGAKPLLAARTVAMLAGAPKDWDEFVPWAERRVRRTPAGVPLPPNPILPQPRWNVIRLAERLSGAQVRCGWQPPPVGTRVLASLGPFRSDAPGPGLEVSTKTTSLGARLWLAIRGFAVPREQVGSIALELRIPFGEYFDLVWGEDGRLRVPLPDNRHFWKLNVTTDNLAEWRGPLEMLAVVADGVGPGPIEIRSIRFLGRTRAFPDPVGVRPVKLDRQSRQTLYMHPPAEVSFPQLQLPAQARLRVGLGQVLPTADGRQTQTAPPDTPLTFEVFVEEHGRRTPVARVAAAGDGKWAELAVDLKPWAGRTVGLVFKVSGGPADAVACWGNPVVYEPVAEPPCLILYLIDALGSRHIDLYGYERPTMPHLRRLAGRGVWFANMFANSSRTVESVPDLLLSLPTERHGVWHSSVRIPSGLVTVAEVLQAAGFATALFSTNVNAGPRQNADQGFDAFFDRVPGSFYVAADRTVPIDDVLAWLEAHRDRPTFVYIHTAEPHAPYTPPPGFAGRFDPDYAGAIDGTFHPRHGFQRARRPRDIAHVVALYDEEVAYADARLGQFLDALAAAGLLERANLLVLADHGEEFLEHGQWLHGRDLHGELLRVPLVVAGPLITARGRQDVPVQIYDIMPTILEMFALPPPYPLAGTSLWPLLNGRADPELRRRLRQRDIVASNYVYRPAGGLEFALISAGGWKLMYRFYGDDGRALPGERLALYDLAADPDEQENLIDAHPDITRRLVGRLLAWRQAQPPFMSAPEADELTFDRQQLDELRELGYIVGDEHP